MEGMILGDIGGSGGGFVGADHAKIKSPSLREIPMEKERSHEEDAALNDVAGALSPEMSNGKRRVELEKRGGTCNKEEDLGMHTCTKGQGKDVGRPKSTCSGVPMQMLEKSAKSVLTWNRRARERSNQTEVVSV